MLINRFTSSNEADDHQHDTLTLSWLSVLQEMQTLVLQRVIAQRLTADVPKSVADRKS